MNEHREDLDKNESLRITSSLVWNSRVMCERRDLWLSTLWKRMISINFGRVNAARTVKERGKSQRTQVLARVRWKKSAILQKMGDTWPQQCEPPWFRLQRERNVIIWGWFWLGDFFANSEHICGRWATLWCRNPLLSCSNFIRVI